MPPLRLPAVALSSPLFVVLFVAGVLLLLGGTATLGWYWFGYETTIVVNDPLRGPVAVQDLGRVSQHLAGMIGGGTLAVLGVMLVLRRPPA